MKPLLNLVRLFISVWRQLLLPISDNYFSPISDNYNLDDVVMV